MVHMQNRLHHFHSPKLPMTSPWPWALSTSPAWPPYTHTPHCGKPLCHCSHCPLCLEYLSCPFVLILASFLSSFTLTLNPYVFLFVYVLFSPGGGQGPGSCHYLTAISVGPDKHSRQTKYLCCMNAYGLEATTRRPAWVGWGNWGQSGYQWLILRGGRAGWITKPISPPPPPWAALCNNTNSPG